MYSDIARMAGELKRPDLMEIDFVLAASSAANKLLKQAETESGAVDYRSVGPRWEAQFKALLETFKG